MSSERFFGIGSYRVSKKELLEASFPENEAVTRYGEALRAVCNQSPERAIPDVLLELSQSGFEHPWIGAANALAFLAYEKRRKPSGGRHFKDALLHQAMLVIYSGLEKDGNEQQYTRAEQTLDDFASFAASFLSSELIPQQERFFTIASKWVHKNRVVAAGPPSDREMGACFWLLGLQIASGVPILDTIDVTGEVVEHPWLLMFLSLAMDKIRDGECFAGGVREGIQDYLRDALNDRLAREFKAQRQEPTGEAHDICVRPLEGKFDIGQLLLPNITQFFERAFNLIDVGEETGALDTTLYRLSSEYLDASDSLYAVKPWSEAVDLALYDLSMYQDNGLPILRSLKILQFQPALESLSQEIGLICEEIQGGATLSEAIANTGGELAHPFILGMLRVGECSGALEVILKRLVVKA